MSLQNLGRESTASTGIAIATTRFQDMESLKTPSRFCYGNSISIAVKHEENEEQNHWSVETSGAEWSRGKYCNQMVEVPFFMMVEWIHTYLFCSVTLDFSHSLIASILDSTSIASIIATAGPKLDKT